MNAPLSLGRTEPSREKRRKLCVNISNIIQVKHGSYMFSRSACERDNGGYTTVTTGPRSRSKSTGWYLVYRRAQFAIKMGQVPIARLNIHRLSLITLSGSKINLSSALSSAFVVDVALGNLDSVLERVNDDLGVNKTRSSRSGDDGETSCGAELGRIESSAGRRGVEGREIGVSPMSSSSSAASGTPGLGTDRNMVLVVNLQSIRLTLLSIAP